MPRLLLKLKSEILSEYHISKQSISIGNGNENDINAKEQSISAHHAEIYLENDDFFIKDHKSAFGTFAGGERISIKRLVPGDHIVLGNSPYSLVFLTEQGESSGGRFIYEIIGIQGKFCGKKYEIGDGETRIGRDDDYNDIVLSGKIDPSISRRHSTIYSQHQQFTISDRRSRNRTFINQREISEQDTIPMQMHDEIVIGHTIFRFCTSETEDFSSPKKASIFFERMKIPLFHGISAIMGLCALVVIGIAFKNLMIIKSPSPLPTVEKSSWSPQILKGDPAVIKPEQYDTTLSPAVGNIMGRNMLGKNIIDIVYAFPYGTVYAWDGVNGEVVWEKPVNLNIPIHASPVLADLNHDNALDVIVAGGDSHIYVIDGISGMLLYKSPLLGGSLNVSPAVGDINKDGNNDIVSCSQEGTVHFIYNPLAAVEVVSVKVSGEILAGPVIYQGFLEDLVIVSTSEGKLYLYSGSNRESKTIDTAERINKFIGTHLPINEITSCPAVSDISGNNEPVIILFSNQYYVTAFNAFSHNIEWLYHVEPPSIKDPPRHFSSPVIADLDGNSIPDVIVTSPNGRVLALQGKTGDLLWEYAAGDWNRIISSPACADLDKDGVVDIIFGSEDGSVYALSGNAYLDPDTDRLFFKAKTRAASITSTPCIGDVDYNGYTDILVSGIDSSLDLFQTNNRVFKGSCLFPMENYDSAHQGYVILPNMRKRIFKMLAAAFTALILVICCQYFFRRNIAKNRPPVIVLQ